MIKHLTSRAVFCLMAVTAILSCNPAMAVTDLTNLRCESRVDPLGIDVAQPRLSWVMLDPEVRSQRQTAYQVLVASSEEVLKTDQSYLWDSGKVAHSNFRKPGLDRRPDPRRSLPLHSAGIPMFFSYQAAPSYDTRGVRRPACRAGWGSPFPATAMVPGTESSIHRRAIMNPALKPGGSIE